LSAKAAGAASSQVNQPGNEAREEEAMSIKKLSHNRRRQVALGSASLALAGISTLAVIGGVGSTASLASPASRAHRVAAGAANTSVQAEGATAATIAGTSHWASGTMQWLAAHHYGMSLVGSAVQASLSSTSAGFEQAPASSPSAPLVQCSMSARTATRNNAVSVCLNPQVNVPSVSDTVQRVRSLRHVGVTLPTYTPGRAPSATAPSVNIGTLPSAQSGNNEVTVNLGTRPSTTPGSVDAGTVGTVNGPHITTN